MMDFLSALYCALGKPVELGIASPRHSEIYRLARAGAGPIMTRNELREIAEMYKGPISEWVSVETITYVAD